MRFKAGGTVGGARVVGNKVSGMGFQSACQSTKSCACITANSMVRVGINVSISNPFSANRSLRAGPLFLGFKQLPLLQTSPCVASPSVEKTSKVHGDLGMATPV